MGKKIGILTFHEADNYGATLQAFALLKTVNKYADGEVINYHCQFILDQIKDVGQSSLPRKIIASLFKMNKHRAFNSFSRKNMALSQGYTGTTKNEMNGKYDLIFVGSDQVWNIECTNLDKTYFLDNIHDETLISTYAASFGSGPYPGDEYSKLLRRFHVISLREEKYIDKLEQVNSNIRVDVDPTMLLTDAEWKNYIKKAPISKKYVFVYLVGEQIDLLKKADEYARRNGCTVITNKKSPEFFLHCSPTDFLNWINFAECVFTNSFHGTVFSILFHKKFTVECKIKGGYNNRASSLLGKTGLEFAMLEKWEEQENTDWNKVDKALKDMRESSLNYLNETISLA